MSNITTTYLVPTTLNARIHKDHSLDHVIRDVQSGVFTRRMTKTSNEQGFISAVYEGKTHKDLHTCLFSCFLSQVEPKKVIQSLTDPRWIEAMQDELLQFELQKVYTQEEGIDYDEVFALVAKIEAIRLFLDYASFKDFVVYQMDVKSAFLYGKIEEEVYVCQPLGFEDPEFPDKVYKVEKTQKDDGIFISQDKYVDEILKKFGFSSVKTASTTMETSKPLLKDENVEDVDVHLYRSMIGSLMYLTASRPDIMFIVSACARFQVIPKVSHLHVLWIQNQMLDYGYNFMNTKIFIDNESTICIIKNPVFHSKTKHIEIRHHFIRDSYEKRLIQMIKIHNDHNVADLLTKAFDNGTAAKDEIQVSVVRVTYYCGPIPLVADKIIINKWEDRMERATTTAYSLEAEQDNANINRTQSMATLNKSFPQGTSSGSGP
ncbi:putative ribonuclease H-like domain-containing protein, partial [Tanacetum coccineum]